MKPGMLREACFLTLAVQRSAEAVLERLDPRRRVAVVMALVGLALVGLFLVAFVMIGAHWVRRLARHRPGAMRFSPSVSENRKLRDPLLEVLPDTKSGDTVLLDAPSKDTKVE
jgi:hypothetical protein